MIGKRYEKVVSLEKWDMYDHDNMFVMLLLSTHQFYYSLAASYGDVFYSAKAIDVTAIARKLVDEFMTKDRLCFYTHHRLDVIFGKDPSPGQVCGSE